MVWVQWEGYPPEEAIWEYIDDLEDNVLFKGGGDVTTAIDTPNNATIQRSIETSVPHPASPTVKNNPPTVDVRHQSG